MGDEPSNGELGRRLDSIQTMLGGLVGRLEYDAEQRSFAIQLRDLAQDLAEERREREKSDEMLARRLDEQARAAADHRLSWRTVLWTGLLPAVMVVLGIVVQLWLARSGGAHR